MPFLNLVGSTTLTTGEKWATSGITTLIGLGMTFVILALLIGTILLMRLILKELEKKLPDLKSKLSKKKNAQLPPPSTEKEPAPVATEEEKPIDKDTLDAINAAVMNYVKTDNNVVIVKSIKKASEVQEEPAIQQETAAPAPVNSAPAPKAVASGKGMSIKAPMPGTVLKIVASDGKQVKEGEVIFVLEAMKMENDIVSPANGIFKVIVAEGTKVNTGDLIAEIQ